MDISAGDSTPTSETSYSRTPNAVPAAGAGSDHHHHHHHPAHPHASSINRPVHHAPPPSTPAPPQRCFPGGSKHNATSLPNTQQASPSSTPTSSSTPMSLASLPRLLSQITAAGSKGLDQSDLSPQKALQTIHTALMLSRQVSLEPGNAAAAATPSFGDTNNHHGLNAFSASSSNAQTPLKVETSNNSAGGDGPPTPTHSESQDYQDTRKGNFLFLTQR
jgi:WW domain-containing adapter protein with coiled-coil